MLKLFLSVSLFASLTYADATATKIECTAGLHADDSIYVVLDLQTKTAVFNERYHEMGIPKTPSSTCKQDASGIRCTFVTTNSDVSEKPEAFEVNLENTGDLDNPIYNKATISTDPWTESGSSLAMTCEPQPQ